MKSNSYHTDFYRLSRDLLHWYDLHGRDLPWRFKRTEKPNPYHVWLSEIMLQQTTVTTVKSYFNNFIEQWPTIDDLANASEDDVLAAWAGLGYYTRGRNLHKAAQQIINDFKGELPDNVPSLKRLKGIGDYSAAAICTIAYNRYAVVMDGNIERIVARLFYATQKLPKAKHQFYQYAKILFDHCYEERYGDYAQALMDLGATICIPKNPQCAICPVQAHCRGRSYEDIGRLPLKEDKKPKPTRYARAFIIIADEERIFLRKRPEKGMLANMMEVPTSEWLERKDDNHQSILYPEGNIKIPVKAEDWQQTGNIVRHSFTHFDFVVECVYAKIETQYIRDIFPNDETQGFYHLSELSRLALPTIMRKIVTAYTDTIIKRVGV